MSVITGDNDNRRRGPMRYKISQRIKATGALVWVVVDTSNNSVVSEGSWTSCSNACREFTQNIPESERLTQKKIDAKGEHRKGFYAFLSQIKQAVFPSTQIVK